VAYFIDEAKRNITESGDTTHATDELCYLRVGAIFVKENKFENLK
jgi:hypothetical protein